MGFNSRGSTSHDSTTIAAFSSRSSFSPARHARGGARRDPEGHTVETLSPADIDALQPRLFTDVPAPKAKYTVDCFLLKVESTYLDDTPTPVTVQVFVPRLPDRASRSLYVFAPGSTGLRDALPPFP